MKSYRPRGFANRRLMPELAALAPVGERRMSAGPHASGGLLLKALRLPDFGTTRSRSRLQGGAGRGHAGEDLPARRDEAEPRAGTSASSAPTRTTQSLAGRPLRHQPVLRGRDQARGPSPPTAGHGGAERHRYRAGWATCSPAATASSAATRPSSTSSTPWSTWRQWLKVWAILAPAHRLPQLPAQLARLAAGQQQLLPRGPGLHRPRRQQEGRDRPRLPPARPTACSR